MESLNVLLIAVVRYVMLCFVVGLTQKLHTSVGMANAEKMVY